MKPFIRPDLDLRRMRLLQLGFTPEQTQAVVDASKRSGDTLLEFLDNVIYWREKGLSVLEVLEMFGAPP
jgi:hypothetical protein